MHRKAIAAVLVAALAGAVIGAAGVLAFAEQGPQGEQGRSGPPGPAGPTADPDEFLNPIGDLQDRLDGIEDRVIELEASAPADASFEIDQLRVRASGIEQDMGELRAEVASICFELSLRC